MKTSIIIPVYNEEETIAQVIEKVISLEIEKEIIIIDDASEDNSLEIIKKYEQEGIILEQHKKNQGKGAAVITGIKKSAGEIIAIQDADLEYDPEQIVVLAEFIKKGRASVVYGSRNLGAHLSYSFYYYLGNIFLSFVTSLLYNTWITDMETCYKVFEKKVLNGIKLKSRGFEIEPEITAKILKKGYKILEYPINYTARGRAQGKKITWIDGVKALYYLIYYRFFD